MFSFRSQQPIVTDPAKIEEVLSRGVAEVITKEALRSSMQKGERLRVKLGIDPTSPHIHLGRAVLLLKLRDFQELGHTVVLIVGDFTGVIGDTSDKESERPMLAESVVRDNAKTYFLQAARLLDLSKTERYYNSEWLSTLTYRDIGFHADKFSLSDFIARENIKRRLDSGSRVSLREVLYPLMQGYDSVSVRADVEIGGTDQRFNLLAGRRLQESLGQRPQQVMTVNLIPGTDGRKMSSSWGNTILVDEDPPSMYGKVMSMPDSVLETYFVSCTRLPLREVQSLLRGHPREAKMRLAREIVALLHSPEEAKKAERNFVVAFQERGIPEVFETVTVPRGTTLLDALAPQFSSKSEVHRLFEGGAISEINGDTLREPSLRVQHPLKLRVGKKRFIEISVR